MPMLRRITAVLAIAFATGTVASCGDAAGLTSTFISITNLWKDVANANHTFDLFSNDDGGTSGQFTGTEYVNENDFTGFPLTGSWASGRISFTVQRSAGNVKYTADMPTDDLDDLTFTSSAGTLHIHK